MRKPERKGTGTTFQAVCQAWVRPVAQTMPNHITDAASKLDAKLARESTNRNNPSQKEGGRQMRRKCALEGV
jgi:hypothetical protein